MWSQFPNLSLKIFLSKVPQKILHSKIQDPCHSNYQGVYCNPSSYCIDTNFNCSKNFNCCQNRMETNNLLTLKDQCNDNTSYDLYLLCAKKHELTLERAKELFNIENIEDQFMLRPNSDYLNAVGNYNIHTACNATLTLEIMNSTNSLRSRLLTNIPLEIPPHRPHRIHQVKNSRFRKVKGLSLNIIKFQYN